MAGSDSDFTDIPHKKLGSSCDCWEPFENVKAMCSSRTEYKQAAGCRKAGSGLHGPGSQFSEAPVHVLLKRSEPSPKAATLNPTLETAVCNTLGGYQVHLGDSF